MIFIVGKAANPKQQDGQDAPKDALGFTTLLPLANSGVYIVVIFQSLHQVSYSFEIKVIIYIIVKLESDRRQLTGQNNNPKNLITGTRQSNDPGMLKYENQVASYIKSSSRHYIRYRVKPIFRGRELLARGVEMEAQSTGSNAVRFHVYIFNVQDGVKLNYSNGTSVVTGTAKKSAKKTVVKKAAAKKSTSSKKKIKTSTTGRIVGNRRSKIYHVPGQAGYHMNSANAVYFRTETEAKRAGYRRAPR